MKISCGSDIIEIKRIKKAITKEKFLEKVYTESEKKYCESKNDNKFEHYAARFAGKEAVYKAISSTLEDKYEIEWKDIEIINNSNGRPFVKIDKITNIENIDISLSHCKEYAVANCVVLWRE